jgi:hypothetical protein
VSRALSPAKLAAIARLHCDYCGRFLSAAEFDDGRATRAMVSPAVEADSETEPMDEIWSTYHGECWAHAGE